MKTIKDTFHLMAETVAVCVLVVGEVVGQEDVLFLAPTNLLTEAKVIVIGKPAEGIPCLDCVNSGFVAPAAAPKTIAIVESGSPAVLWPTFFTPSVPSLEIRSGDKLVNRMVIGYCGGLWVYVADIENARGLGNLLLLGPPGVIFDDDEAVVTGKPNDDGSCNLLIVSQIKGELPHKVDVYSDMELQNGDRLTNFIEVGDGVYEAHVAE